MVQGKSAPSERFSLSAVDEEGDAARTAHQRGQSELDRAERWTRLTKRIHKDYPEFPVLSFNKLRKTASNFIRRKFGGEVADIFLCHGKQEMVDAYTDTPFARVHKAIRRLGKALEPMFNLVPVPFPEDARKSNPALSRGEIKRIIELRQQGFLIKKICEVVGVTPDTVRRYMKQHNAQQMQQETQQGIES
jgi:hypothetical protein